MFRCSKATLAAGSIFAAWWNPEFPPPLQLSCCTQIPAFLATHAISGSQIPDRELAECLNPGRTSSEVYPVFKYSSPGFSADWAFDGDRKLSGNCAHICDRENIAGLLYGVGTYNITAILFSIVILGSTALAAAWIPTHRASAIDPIQALRHE